MRYGEYQLNNLTMKTSNILLLSIFFSLALATQAQQSGNTVYAQNYNQTFGKQQNINKLSLNDSTFLIEGSVVMNVVADAYVATFGVTEEAETVADCNVNIEKRIQGFLSDLNAFGIAKQDIYVDMTTQNRTYDYRVKGEKAEEFIKGFELKKNVIVKFSHIKDLEQLMVFGASHQIYDLVKVDYHVIDIHSIYTKMFESAMEVINQKKVLYAASTNSKTDSKLQVYAEKFYSYTPSQLYKSYKAYGSSNEDGEYDQYDKIPLRKNTTYYFDKMDYSGFDQVINPVVIEPVVEFILIIQIKCQNL
jgi:uncharacterized protein YggE